MAIGIFRRSGRIGLIAAAHLNPAGSLIASVDFSGTILIWDIERALPVDRILAGGSTNNVAWLPNGQLITGLGDQRLINVYALTTAPTNLDADCLNPLGWNVVPSRRGPWPKSCSSGVIQSR